MTRQLRSRRKRSALERGGCSTGFDLHAGLGFLCYLKSNSDGFRDPRVKQLMSGFKKLEDGSPRVLDRGVTVIGLFGLRSQTDAYFIAVTIPMAVLTISCSRRHGWSQPIF